MRPKNEFSCTIPASEIGQKPYSVTFSADEDERAALAARLNILSIEKLEGKAELVREADGVTVAVTGTLYAQATQACIATLQPVPETIKATLEGYYLDDSQAVSFARVKRQKESHGDPEIPLEREITSERDDPEPLDNGMIDVGELASQHLSLSLDPFPRAAGAEMPPELAGQQKESPFAALAALKDSMGKK